MLYNYLATCSLAFLSVHHSILGVWEGVYGRTLQMAQIALLVKVRFLQPKAVRDVEDRLGGIVESLLTFFG